MLKILILCFSLSTLAFGTTFKPVTVDEQLKAADGIIIGHFLNKRTIELEDGLVATQMIFKLNKEWGMQSDLFGMEEIIIHFPGGKLKEKIVQVHGVPEFVPGEKVVLLAKSVKNRFWGLNLGLGSYKVINYGHETMLINTIFPSDTRVSQIRVSDFELKVKQVKGSGLKVVMSLPDPAMNISERKPASFVQEGKKRSVASTQEESENGDDQSSLSIYWLVALLALTGAGSHLLRQKKS